MSAGSVNPVPKTLVSPKPEYRLDNSVPNRFLEHIAGKWRAIALQEVIEYLQLECLTNHFYIVLSCSTRTCHSNITVKSIYLHDKRTGNVKP